MRPKSKSWILGERNREGCRGKQQSKHDTHTLSLFVQPCIVPPLEELRSVTRSSDHAIPIYFRQPSQSLSHQKPELVSRLFCPRHRCLVFMSSTLLFPHSSRNKANEFHQCKHRPSDPCSCAPERVFLHCKRKLCSLPDCCRFHGLLSTLGQSFEKSVRDPVIAANKVDAHMTQIWTRSPRRHPDSFSDLRPSQLAF